MNIKRLLAINLAFGLGSGAFACIPLTFFAPKTASTYGALCLGVTGASLAFNSFLARNHDEYRPRIVFTGAAMAVAGMTYLLTPAIEKIEERLIHWNPCRSGGEFYLRPNCGGAPLFQHHM